MPQIIRISFWKGCVIDNFHVTTKTKITKFQNKFWTKQEREIEAKLKTMEVNDDVKKERPRSGGSNIHPENSNDNNHGTVSEMFF